MKNETSKEKITDESLFISKYHSSMQNIVIPDGVKRIPAYAFYGCFSLKKITLPKSVKSIGEAAFNNFNRLTICGYRGSYAEKYAKMHHMYFLEIEEYPRMKSTDWFFDAVAFANEKGYFEGYDDSALGAKGNIKRQDFAMVLARMDGVDLRKYDTISKISDVKTGEYYTAAVNWAYDVGIIDLYKNGKFGVDDNITREQLITMLYRYAVYKGYSVEHSDKKAKKFTDYRHVSKYAKEAINWAADKGIINGIDKIHIDPQGNASRAQVAQILKNISDNNILPI